MEENKKDGDSTEMISKKSVSENNKNFINKNIINNKFFLQNIIDSLASKHTIFIFIFIGLGYLLGTATVIFEFSPIFTFISVLLLCLIANHIIFKINNKENNS